MERQFRVNRKHGGAVNLVKSGIGLNAPAGSCRVNFHQLLIGHLAGPPAGAARLAVGQHLRAAGGSLLSCGAAGIGVDGQVIVGLPLDGLCHAHPQGSCRRRYFYQKAAALQGSGSFFGNRGGNIVLKQRGIAKIRAMRGRPALRGKINFETHKKAPFGGVFYTMAGPGLCKVPPLIPTKAPFFAGKWYISHIF